jgi:replicative DNA helicase
MAYLRQNVKELHKVYQALDQLWTKFPDAEQHSLDDLQAHFWSLNPQLRGQEVEMYDVLFSALKELTVSSEILQDTIVTMHRRHEAGNLSRLAYEVASGEKSYEALTEHLQKLSLQSDAPSVDVDFVSDDLDELIHETVSSGGLRWRLHSLNRRLGPLRKGNFGIVFARVETGKTTFLADCASNFAVQSDRPVLWFNNEEVGSNVKLRVVQSHFGADLPTILANRGTFKSRYSEEIGGRLKMVDNAVIDRRYAERIIQQEKPSIIIFDQLDKIRGFDADRPDLVLGKVYQWAREMAKTHAPVIGVCQADGQAEGVRWLEMNHMADSKTAKPAEADWILGIGKQNSQGMEHVRHFHLCKNKLVGDEHVDPTLRHDRWDVLIEPSIARYKDFTATDEE